MEENGEAVHKVSHFPVVRRDVIADVNGLLAEAPAELREVRDCGVVLGMALGPSEAEPFWLSNGAQRGPGVLPHGGMLPEPSFCVR